MYQQTLAVAFWFLPAAVLAAVFLLVRQHRAARGLRERSAATEAGLRIRAEEEQHLIGTRLPALAESLSHRPVELPGPMHSELAEAP
jgi:hypothetical protein